MRISPKLSLPALPRRDERPRSHSPSGLSYPSTFFCLPASPPATAKHRRNQPHAVPFRRADKAMSCPIGVACFNAKRTAVFLQKAVCICHTARVPSSQIRHINLLLCDNLPKGFVFQRIRPNQRHIVGCGVVLLSCQVAVQPVWRAKNRIPLRRFPLPSSSFPHRTSPRFPKSAPPVPPPHHIGAQEHGRKQISDLPLLPSCKLMCTFGCCAAFFADRDNLRQACPLQNQYRRHNLRGACHRKGASAFFPHNSRPVFPSINAAPCAATVGSAARVGTLPICNKKSRKKRIALRFIGIPPPAIFILFFTYV